LSAPQLHPPGVSQQANTQALLSLAGTLAPEDILKAEWSASDFRPCHYVALDRRARRIVISVRGSLEVSDLYTDVAAAPVAWEFNGTRGFVHEGLLSAATYVHASTSEVLAEAVRDHPGWPVLLTGERSWVGESQGGRRNQFHLGCFCTLEHTHFLTPPLLPTTPQHKQATRSAAAWPRW
jgi:hypothetical protein